MRAQKRASMADIAAAVSAAPPKSRTGRSAVRPGTVTAAGELCDRGGNLLALRGAGVLPAEVVRILPSVVAVLWESCGCGGSADCRAVWLTADELRRLQDAEPPRFTDAHGAPTWIDIWQGPTGPVIYAHGDVTWGDALL